MNKAIRVGIFYFIGVFGVGFLLGTIRVLVLTPRVGELVSTLIELPIILSAAWIVSGFLTTRFKVPSDWWTRLRIGLIAFGLLMAAELGLSVWVVGNTMPEHFAAYQSLPKTLGLAGQVVFAFIPLLQREKHERSATD